MNIKNLSSSSRKNKIIGGLLSCTLLILLSSCTGNPYRDNQIMGTAGGAAVGGLVGHAIGGNTAGTIIGGAVGAGVGSAATSRHY